MADILVVEDYKNEQFVYSTMLERAGHTVDVARDGTDALAKAKLKTYDVILLDMLLTRVNGNDFLRAFKAKQHPQTKVVVFSNITNPKMVDEALGLGAVSYFTKAHYTPAEVVKCIDDVLHESAKPQ